MIHLFVWAEIVLCHNCIKIQHETIIVKNSFCDFSYITCYQVLAAPLMTLP